MDGCGLLAAAEIWRAASRTRASHTAVQLGAISNAIRSSWDGLDDMLNRQFTYLCIELGLQVFFFFLLKIR